ncbi:alpha/beta hydrolase [Mycobacterium sp. 050128]|uniref:alpha/beta fold hydrolase n=1 Tax=Mycobacterium sp. 050128 TaxID=3096112 RepID=UPI00128FBEF3
MSTARIRSVHLAGAPQLPPMVLGPSLGVPVTALWSSTADRLGRSHHVIGWDLPGHGASPPLTTSCTIGELADAVAALADTEIGDRPFVYAGVSVGGAVGLQVLLDHPGRISAAALICTGAKIGTPEDWIARAGSVRRDGMGAMVPGAAQRWFAQGFTERDPAVHSMLLESLRSVDSDSYAFICEALAEFDVRERLSEIDTPIVALAGADDVVTPPTSLLFIAERVSRGRYIELLQTAHLAPVERPDWVAPLVAGLDEWSHR